MSPLIEVSSLGKKYSIRSKSGDLSHRSLKNRLHQLLTGKWGKERDEAFWALEDLSFSISKGEVVAILGHNGSGKSTLLKIISRITEPTAGKVSLYGHLGALLEVGTGMHPDLTGRDNIYFCGALLGMKRNEITKHLDAIVAFADIAPFLDTPLKKYSSGMALRLACSVLFHLRTDLLILDEVLSIGDWTFQSKCFEKIKEVASEGRVILCVTHHEEWISTYCSRALLLHHGHLVEDGAAVDVLKKYHALTAR